MKLLFFVKSKIVKTQIRNNQIREKYPLPKSLDEKTPVACHPMKTSTSGFIDWMLTDVRHGFQSFSDEEVLLILQDKCVEANLAKVPYSWFFKEFSL